jgi:hypothetical protein
MLGQADSHSPGTDVRSIHSPGRARFHNCTSTRERRDSADLRC